MKSEKDKQYLENTESYLLTVITNTIDVMQKLIILDMTNILTISCQCAMKIQEVNSFVLMCDLLFNTNNFKNLNFSVNFIIIKLFYITNNSRKNKCYTLKV